jgi:heterodisulfide reductase subunit A
MCSDPGQELIKDDVKEHGLTHVVVASCSPRMHEPTFRGVVEEAGINPYCFEMANIREQCSWVHEDREWATEKAKQLVASAVAKAALLRPLEEREVGVTPAALVIGGGIAGIEAALDIANAGFKVYLVEKEPTIGGRVAQLNRTFPTLESCLELLGPRMRAVAEHPNIELLTSSEVVDIGGYIGNFQVKVRRRPRYVDADRCTACGECAEACVLKGQIDDEFQLGLGRRAAVYMPFAEAVPPIYTIDPEHCLLLQEGGCGESLACVDACPESAIDFNQQEETIEFEVGSIVVAIGYDQFDPRIKPELGYGQYPNVITGLEFERLSSASGPTGGRISLNGREPRDVVFIQCVGSRDQSVGNEYCSRVCCMYTAKQAHLVKERIPDANVTVFYMDVRAFGKGFEEFYDRVKHEGVMYRRGSVSEIYKRGDRVVVRAEDTLLGEPLEIEADLVVLATGVVPRVDVEDVAGLLNLERSPDGFFAEAHPKMRPVDTVSDGIYLAGCCQGPKDIPDTVAQAKAAAASAIVVLRQEQAKLEVQISKLKYES